MYRDLGTPPGSQPDHAQRDHGGRRLARPHRVLRLRRRRVLTSGQAMIVVQLDGVTRGQPRSLSTDFPRSSVLRQARVTALSQLAALVERPRCATPWRTAWDRPSRRGTPGRALRACPTARGRTRSARVAAPPHVQPLRTPRHGWSSSVAQGARRSAEPGMGYVTMVEPRTLSWRRRRSRRLCRRRESPACASLSSTSPCSSPHPMRLEVCRP